MSTTTKMPGGLTAASAAKQAGDKLQTVLGGADTTAATRVQTLSLIHQARVSRLTRTAATVTAQYGATSTQAAAAQAAVTASQTTVARVTSVQRQAATPAPQVPATGWVLHGRVYNSQLQPAIRYTVFLVDAQKTYQSSTGFSYTDETGYFTLSFAGAPASTDSANAPASPPQLFVEIANTAGKPVYLSTTAFEPSIGNAIYQNITLPAGEPVLGDPPAEISRTALPPKG